MANTTVREALWRVSTLLNDVAPQFARWPEQELVAWLDDAQRAITKFLPAACARVDAIKLKPGTRQSIASIAALDCKPGDGSTPSTPINGVQPVDFICNMGADGLTPGAAIPPPVMRRVLDANLPNWHTVTGTKVDQVVYNPQTPQYFFVQPAVPASPAQWIMLGYIAQPALIPNTGTPGSELYAFSGGSTTKISVDDVHLDDLVDYVCARALMKNADVAGNGLTAQFFTSRFLGSLNLRITALTGSNPNLKKLPFAPEPMGAAG